MLFFYLYLLNHQKNQESDLRATEKRVRTECTAQFTESNKVTQQQLTKVTEELQQAQTHLATSIAEKKECLAAEVKEVEKIVEKEVIKEVPGPERIVEKEVVVEKEVIKEVPGPERVVEKEVVKEVPGPERVVEKVVEKEVIKEVPGPERIVEKEVEKIVEKEVIKEVPGPVVEKIVEKEVIKEVPGPERIVEKEVAGPERTVEVNKCLPSKDHVSIAGLVMTAVDRVSEKQVVSNDDVKRVMYSWDWILKQLKSPKALAAPGMGAVLNQPGVGQYVSYCYLWVRHFPRPNRTIIFHTAVQ